MHIAQYSFLLPPNTLPSSLASLVTQTPGTWAWSLSPYCNWRTCVVWESEPNGKFSLKLKQSLIIWKDFSAVHPVLAVPSPEGSWHLWFYNKRSLGKHHTTGRIPIPSHPGFHGLPSWVRRFSKPQLTKSYYSGPVSHRDIQKQLLLHRLAHTSFK